MCAALPLCPVGEANATRHDAIVAIFMRALATDILGHLGVVQRGVLFHGFLWLVGDTFLGGRWSEIHFWQLHFWGGGGRRCIFGSYIFGGEVVGDAFL